MKNNDGNLKEYYDYRIKEDTKEYKMFLDQVGRGCTSGHFSEWPQLRPACTWAVNEIEKLRWFGTICVAIISILLVVIIL